MIISCDDPVSKGAQRFEVFTGAGKRREWPVEVKASIVAECYSGNEGISAVARRHGLDPSQLYVWRRDLRKALEDRGLVLPVASDQTLSFVPAVIEAAALNAPAPSARSPRHSRTLHSRTRRRRSQASAVELEIDGVAVKIGRDADAGVIAAVIEALKAQR